MPLEGGPAVTSALEGSGYLGTSAPTVPVEPGQTWTTIAGTWADQTDTWTEV